MRTAYHTLMKSYKNLF